MPFSHATVATAVLLAIAAPAAAQTFTTFDHPFADLTFLHGISGNTAVGRWEDVGDNTAGSFLYNITTGSSSPINNPTSPDPRHTLVLAIAGNRLAGTQADTFTPDADQTAFLFDGSTWNVFSLHTAPDGRTIAYGLDDDTNTVVGSYADATHTRRGFVRDPSGTVTTLQYPGSLETEAYDIDTNRIVGFYVLPTFHTGGFLYDGLNWTPVNFPGAAEGTLPKAIDGNLVVGDFFDTDAFRRRGFIHDLSTNTWTPFDAPVPDLNWTTISDIDGNTIVGHYMTTNGLIHAFVATVPEPSATVVILLTLASVRRRRQPH